MKKQPLLLIICLMFCFSAAFTKDSVHRDSVRKYYDLVYKAELSLVDSQYLQAQRLYTKAFALKNPNGKDLVNAYTTAFILKDTVTAQQYIHQLAWSGLPQKRLAWKVEKENPQFYELLLQGYDSIRNARMNTDKEALAMVQSLDSLVKADQDIRYQTKDRQEYEKVDIADVNCLRKLMEQYGFPGFTKVGYLGTEAYTTSPPGFWYILWHRRPNKTPVDSFVEQAVLDGDFPPELWAEIISERDDYYGMILPKEKQTPAQIAEINKRRGKIYLEPLNDYRKKMTYVHRFKPPFYFYHGLLIGVNLATIDVEK